MLRGNQERKVMTTDEYWQARFKAIEDSREFKKKEAEDEAKREIAELDEDHKKYDA